MAFDRDRWTRVSLADNTGAITLDDASVGRPEKRQWYIRIGLIVCDYWSLLQKVTQ